MINTEVLQNALLIGLAIGAVLGVIIVRASHREEAVRGGPLAHLFRGFVRAYQFVLSPLLGRQCRFLPTCSAYALEALERHGAARGGWLAFRRVCRCRPGGGSGVDNVPD